MAQSLSLFSFNGSGGGRKKGWTATEAGPSPLRLVEWHFAPGLSFVVTAFPDAMGSFKLPPVGPRKGRREENPHQEDSHQSHSTLAIDVADQLSSLSVISDPVPVFVCLTHVVSSKEFVIACSSLCRAG